MRPRRGVALGALVALGAAAGLAGCSTIARDLRPWENTTPSSRYDPALSTAPKCITAAKRATYWCQKVNQDGSVYLHQQGQVSDTYECNNAEYDFYRYCR